MKTKRKQENSRKKGDLDIKNEVSNLFLKVFDYYNELSDYDKSFVDMIYRGLEQDAAFTVKQIAYLKKLSQRFKVPVKQKEIDNTPYTLKDLVEALKALKVGQSLTIGITKTEKDLLVELEVK